MELTFTVTKEEADMMMDALTKEPYLKVVNLVDKLQGQAIEQMKPKEVVK